VEKAVDEVRKYIHVPVYQQEFDALVSLAFNAGSFRKFPNLVSRINTADYSGGCNEFADITNGGTSGLVKRRQAEMKMFRNNIYDSSH
jgi:GH24 family phage-related lysozyme (muramidase)